MGFLPPSAFRDACIQRRLIAAIETNARGPVVVGYLLFGGLYPRARIYQVGVASGHRRSGVASRLLNVLVSRLEAAGYLSLSARVAKDLTHAIAFYSSNGFALTKEVAGGSSRDRRLLVVDRRLKTNDLLSVLDVNQSQSDLLALALRSSASGDMPFYVIDLNVLFDLIRERSRSRDARRLFGAALAHRIRLVVSPEFLVELRRTTLAHAQDPVLQMALQLPQLVQASRPDLEHLATLVHRIVFEDTLSPAAGRPQSISDSRHVAHAVLSRASGFITSDGQILAVRDRLRTEIGIDVASIDELLELVPYDTARAGQYHAFGEGFDLGAISDGELREYLERLQAPKAVVAEFASDTPTRPKGRRYAVRQEGRAVAVSALLLPSNATAAAGLFIHSDPKVLTGDLFYDCLFDRAVLDATAQGPVLLELRLMASDTSGSVAAFARSRGFLSGRDATTLFKVALGRSLTKATWGRVSLMLARRTGLALGQIADGQGFATLSLPNGQVVNLPFAQLEDFLGPAAIAWPGRRGVIQPISSRYADELLGTGAQQSLLDSREAAFLSRRSYASSPRSARRMSPGTLIFFYESQRTGGRGAVVAVARVVDALTISKDAVSRDRTRRMVVSDLSEITSTSDALLTTFDNLLVFPRPCPLATLRAFGAVDAQNLQTTTVVTEAVVGQMLDFGWADGAS